MGVIRANKIKMLAYLLACLEREIYARLVKVLSALRGMGWPRTVPPARRSCSSSTHDTEQQHGTEHLRGSTEMLSATYFSLPDVLASQHGCWCLCEG